MTQLVDRELAADGVDADGYALLSLIGVRGGSRLTELAGELGLPLTTASDVVRRLERRGLVRRRTNPFAVRPGNDPWITCIGTTSTPGFALRLDASTNRVTARVRVGRAPGDGAIDTAGRVWIPNKSDGTVSRLDPATNTVVETVQVGGGPFVVNEAFGDVWVPDNIGSQVARLHVEG